MDKELKRQRDKDSEHDSELARQRRKDIEHDQMITEISARLARIECVNIPMWLKVIVFLDLILSVTAIGMILLK
jgi:hypothetical protein